MEAAWGFCVWVGGCCSCCGFEGGGSVAEGGSRRGRYGSTRVISVWAYLGEERRAWRVDTGGSLVGGRKNSA